MTWRIGENRLHNTERTSLLPPWNSRFSFDRNNRCFALTSFFSVQRLLRFLNMADEITIATTNEDVEKQTQASSHAEQTSRLTSSPVIDDPFKWTLRKKFLVASSEFSIWVWYLHQPKAVLYHSWLTKELFFPIDSHLHGSPFSHLLIQCIRIFHRSN